MKQPPRLGRHPDVVGREAPLRAELSPHAITFLLDERGVRSVSFDEWKILDELEIANGSAKGKVRDKFTSLPAMLEALKTARG